MSDAIIEGALIGAVVGLVVMGVGFIVALTRKRTFAGAPRPTRLQTVEVDVSVADAADAIRRMTEGTGPYRLAEDAVESAGLITVTNMPTLFSWGFFFPCYLEARDGGGTTITVGIASRFFQWGPVVTNHHKKACKAIEDAVRAP